MQIIHLTLLHLHLFQQIAVFFAQENSKFLSQRLIYQSTFCVYFFFASDDGKNEPKKKTSLEKMGKRKIVSLAFICT